MYNHRFRLTLAFITAIILLTFTACGDTPTPEETPAITPTQTPEEITMTAPTPTQNPNLSSAEKLEIDDISLENIECVEFSYTKEVVALFRTSDPVMMEDILTHFKSVTLSPPAELNVEGGEFYVTFHFKEKINNRSSRKITVQPYGMYSTDRINYEVTEGAKTYEEWEAIMAACEQIKP